MPLQNDGPERQSKRSPWRFLPLALLILGTAIVFASGAHRYLSFEALIQHRQRLQSFVDEHESTAMLLYVAIYIIAVTLSVPGAAFLTMTGGFLFGWLVGGAAAAIASTLGATGLFLVARTSVGDALLRRGGGPVQALAAGFRADAFSYLLFLRFLPIVPFWMTNLAAALFGVPLRTFFLCTMIGVIPATYAFAVTGSGLDSIIAAQQAGREACIAAGGTDCGFDLSLASLLTPQIIAAFVALGVLSLAPIVVKRFYRRRLKSFAGEREGARPADR